MENVIKNNLVTHSNKITEARYVLSEKEQKIIFAMVSMIKPNDSDFYAYKIYQKDLAELLGMDKKSAVREFDRITDRLMKRILNIPQDDGSFLKTHWVSDIVFRDGFLEVYFSPKLKPYLLKLKDHFTSYKYGGILNFTGKHTIRIYQLLKEYEYQKSFEIKVSKFREILCFGEKTYTKFYELRRWVLNAANKEFTDIKEIYIDDDGKEIPIYKSDLNFELKTRRTGRKISHLKFIIKKQRIKKPVSKKGNKKNDKDSDKKPQIIQDYGKYGVIKDVERLLEERGDESLKNTFDYFEIELETKGDKIRDKGAYLHHLLVIEAGQKTKEEIEQEKREAEARKRKELQQRIESIKEQEKEFGELYGEMVKETFLSNLSEKQKEELIEELKEENPEFVQFITSLESGVGGSFLTRKIKILEPEYEEKKINYIINNLMKKNLIVSKEEYNELLKE